MTRRLAALVAAWAILLAGPTLVGPATPVALGHSQLVTSVPAAGEVVAVAPESIRLVFSEPIEAVYTKLDLLDATGRTIATGIGAPDPADRFALVAPIQPLPDGVYTVNWQALSAADGHVTSGFFTFGVGNVTPPPAGGSTPGAGSIHAGHDAGTAFLETESRIAGDGGLLLALGLALVSFLVLRRPGSRGLARLVAACLGVAASGAAGLIVLGGTTVGLDPVAYVAQSRAGALLGARAGVTLAAAVLVLAVARRDARLAVAVGGSAGFVGLLLVAIGGHAAAYDSPAPVAAVAVHLVAAAIWLAGLLTLAWIALGGAEPEEPLPTLVGRFSALALVSGGLIALTGAYSDWVQTRALVALDTPYSTTLMVKSGLAIAAFSLGAFNHFSGGRPADRRFRPRVVIEAGLALAVVVATGVLASGSPPALERPIAIAALPSSVVPGVAPPVLELAPGRPGPTRIVVQLPTAPEHVTVELLLQRLDRGGSSRLTLAPEAATGTFAAGGALLPAGSRWDASVVVRGRDGSEQYRTRYAFALDAAGISEGRATPPLDPAIIIALVLLAGAALGVAFALGGGSLPRVDPAASRVALLGGSLAGALSGALILLAGPRL